MRRLVLFVLIFTWGVSLAAPVAEANYGGSPIFTPPVFPIICRTFKFFALPHTRWCNETTPPSTEDPMKDFRERLRDFLNEIKLKNGRN